MTGYVENIKHFVDKTENLELCLLRISIEYSVNFKKYQLQTNRNEILIFMLFIGA